MPLLLSDYIWENLSTKKEVTFIKVAISNSIALTLLLIGIAIIIICKDAEAKAKLALGTTDCTLYEMQYSGDPAWSSSLLVNATKTQVTRQDIVEHGGVAHQTIKTGTTMVQYLKRDCVVTTLTIMSKEHLVGLAEREKRLKKEERRKKGDCCHKPQDQVLDKNGPSTKDTKRKGKKGKKGSGKKGGKDSEEGAKTIATKNKLVSSDDFNTDDDEARDLEGGGTKAKSVSVVAVESTSTPDRAPAVGQTSAEAMEEGSRDPEKDSLFEELKQFKHTGHRKTEIIAVPKLARFDVAWPKENESTGGGVRPFDINLPAIKPGVHLPEDIEALIPVPRPNTALSPAARRYQVSHYQRTSARASPERPIFFLQKIAFHCVS